MPYKSGIIPCLTYKDAKTAIDWLCNAFGFERHQVFEGEDGSIAHAELTLNGSMIMLGSANEQSPWGKHIRLPKAMGGFETQTPYIIIPDPDAHYAQAKAHGATILLDIKTEDYGGRGYSCADPEGHLWTFGSYDPWEK